MSFIRKEGIVNGIAKPTTKFLNKCVLWQLHFFLFFLPLYFMLNFVNRQRNYIIMKLDLRTDAASDAISLGNETFLLPRYHRRWAVSMAQLRTVSRGNFWCQVDIPSPLHGYTNNIFTRGVCESRYLHSVP